MFKKIFCLILILKLTKVSYGFVPKFYGQDIAIIVDAGKTFAQNKNAAVKFPNRIRMPPPFPLWRYYPRYHIIPAPPAGQILAINPWDKTVNAKPATKTSTTSTSTTSTTTPKPTVASTTFSSPLLTDEFPAEFLDVARNKLGLKNIEEIPSISELGQLFGTNTAEETMEYMKQLTSNEQGIALVKAYIESTDYTDNTADLGNKNDYLANDEEDDEDLLGNIEEPLKANDEGLIVITDEDSNDDYELDNDKEQTEDNTPRTSVLESLENYTNSYNFLQQQNEDRENQKYHQLDRITENGKKVSNEYQENQTESAVTKEPETKNYNLKNPILVRESIPYNYPVPIRIQTPTTTSTLPPLSNTPVVHLNTPKIIIPHVQQLSRLTQIPSKQIEDFLASKPKLLELVTKVSRFPIGYGRNSPIESQILAAVQKAFKQNDDLRNLLSSAPTLK